jgi:hypothetical protein
MRALLFSVVFSQLDTILSYLYHSSTGRSNNGSDGLESLSPDRYTDGRG